MPSELAAIEQHLALLPAGAAVQVWLCKPLAVRRACQQQWRERWPHLQVHGAYKPLLSWVVDHLLEGWRAKPPSQVKLHYPVLDGLHPERFLLESYPLALWLSDLGSAYQFCPVPVQAGAEAHYQLWVDGQQYAVAIPARWASDLSGEQVLRPTARVQAGAEVWDILSDAEQVWDAYATLLPTLPLAAQPPYVGRLSLEAALCAPDDPLPTITTLHHEALSVQEGLAEDFYFGTLEYWQARAGLAQGSRTLQTGQIVPLVRSVGPEKAPSLSVRVEPLSSLPSANPEPLPDFASLGRPLTLGEVAGLPAGAAQVHTFTSVQGQSIRAFQWGKGAGGMLLTAGQHANETTGVAAAAQFWQELTQQPKPLPLPLAYIPLENPDGYALHLELCKLAPTHMHHAARYTALGDDLEYRPEAEYEKAARVTLGQQARLHVNLHGYPAHEWTRPMSGYAPRHFEAWALPKGFFVLIRYGAGQRASAEALAQAVTLRLSHLSDLMTFNASQRHVYEQHTAARPYELLHGTPIVLQERADLFCPLTLITEFPDETVYGDLFRLGVKAQLSTTQAAWDWLITQDLGH